MKRRTLLLFVVSLFCLGSGKAQIAKGSILAGGNFGYNSSTNSGGFKQTGYYVSPSFGIAIRENLFIGTNLRYVFQDNDASSSDDRNYGAAIFLRRYKPLGKGFYLFGQADLGFEQNRHQQSIITNQNYDIHINKSHTFRLSLNPGISYALTNRFQLELMFIDLLSASYSRFKKESKNHQTLLEPKGKSFSVNSNLSLNGVNSLGIGVQFLFNKSK